GRFELLDLEHIAEEIEDVGKSEQRELENRMAVLIAHLLKWQYQPTHRGASWQRTIKDQRKMVLKRLKQTPSLKISLVDVEWIDDAWTDATLQAAKETGIELIKFPQACPWTMEQVLDDEFLPS
ncbi:MAG TPA: DUF29 domain-containing protein, partial [Agitococcus sp.]|nr:DUF29 domain-containing protein [Agitococcus sp.]